MFVSLPDYYRTMKTTQVLCVTLIVVLGQIDTVFSRPSLPNSIQNENKAARKDNDEHQSKTLKNTEPQPNDDHRPSKAEEGDLKTAESNRRNKMLDFFGGFYPHPFMAQYQNPFFQPQPYYDDSTNFEEEDLMSRANRRKPSNRDSPIFYVRLPPTPYMYVPGMGYISQPPTIRPMAIAPPMPPPVVNPFINVPVNFIANGKPTNVYEWPNTAQMNFGQPQYPSYVPSRPTHQRPQSYRPHKPSYLGDSKITHLKGPYVFNGRPEDIYVLPQSAPPSSQFGLNSYNQGFAGGQDYSQHQQHQQQQQQEYQNAQNQHNYQPSHHQQSFNGAPVSHFGGYNTAYNGGYNPIYSDALAHYY